MYGLYLRLLYSLHLEVQTLDWGHVSWEIYILNALKAQRKYSSKYRFEMNLIVDLLNCLIEAMNCKIHGFIYDRFDTREMIETLQYAHKHLEFDNNIFCS